MVPMFEGEVYAMDADGFRFGLSVDSALCWWFESMLVKVEAVEHAEFRYACLEISVRCAAVSGVAR